MKLAREYLMRMARKGDPAAEAALHEMVATRPLTESEQVMQFMVKFGHMFVTGQGEPLHLHPPTDHPRHLTLRKLEDRHKQMEEELGEFYDAMHDGDLAKLADSLVDLVYFAKGTAALMGLPWGALWDDVHRANMAKVRGEQVRGGRVIKVDCVKPDGWQPPRTLDVLRDAGYLPGIHDKAFWDDPEHCPGGPHTAVESPSPAPGATALACAGDRHLTAVGASSCFCGLLKYERPLLGGAVEVTRG